MANLMRPLRPTVRAPKRLALKFKCDSDAFLAQNESLVGLLNVDAITALLESIPHVGHVHSLPGLAAFTRLASTCKLIRGLSAGVHTPFDVAIFERTGHGIAFDKVPNLNDHSFYVSKCCNDSGTNAPKAGVRLALSSQDGGDPAELVVVHHSDDSHGSRAAVFISRPHSTLPGDVAMELAIDDLVNALSRHSKKSLVSVTKAGGDIHVAFVGGSKRMADIGVVNDDEFINEAATDQELKDDSMNSLVVFIRPNDDRDAEVRPRHIEFRFGYGGNPFFSDQTFLVDRPDHLVSLFGALESTDVAILPIGPPLYSVDDTCSDAPPSPKGAAIASAVAAWAKAARAEFGCPEPAPPPTRRKSVFDGFVDIGNRIDTPKPPQKRGREDAAAISLSNVCSGRRSAALGADLKLCRQVQQLDAYDDGRLTPAHPEYAGEKANEDAANAKNIRHGRPLERFAHLVHSDDETDDDETNDVDIDDDDETNDVDIDDDDETDDVDIDDDAIYVD